MIYALVSENLTGLGGPMGTERTWDNWVRYFSTEDLAKEAAVADYKGPIDWVKTENGCRSPDLRWVMYHIRKIEVEK